MAPCIADGSGSGKKGVSKSDATAASLQLGAIRAHLPEHVFVKSISKSLFYMAFDLTMWLGSTAVMYGIVTSGYWNHFPLLVQAALTLAYWAIAGFFMWCVFVVGHDCGHGTFSDYELFNDVLGNILHGAILVPYFPWRLSHARHHMYHNHAHKDYSHPWYTDERYNLPEEGKARFWRDHPALRATLPIYGWFIYLLGMPDGSHFLPFSSARMWIGTPMSEKVKCVISTGFVVFFAVLIYRICGSNVGNMAYYYLVPLLVFGWWLSTVTYLQHHTPETLVYDDSNWKFVDAAFETVDRTYGYGVDTLSHHITDGHVIHHLFYTKIPHYHLADATAALQDYMKDNKVLSLYRHENTYDFFFKVFAYFYSFGYSSQMSVKTKNKVGVKSD